MWVWSLGESIELKTKISACCGIYSLAWDGWIRSLGENRGKRETLLRDQAGACSNIQRLGEEGGKKNPMKKIKEEQVISGLLKWFQKGFLIKMVDLSPFLSSIDFTDVIVNVYE